jgi:hypothetical protein
MEKAPKILFLGSQKEECDRVQGLLQDSTLTHAADLVAAFEFLGQEKFDLVLLSVSGVAEDGVARPALPGCAHRCAR